MVLGVTIDFYILISSFLASSVLKVVCVIDLFKLFILFENHLCNMAAFSNF